MRTLRSAASAALVSFVTSAVPASARAQETPLPAIDDPMLAAPPPAKREVKSWDDALALTRSRSTNLATAFAEVKRAEAASETAIAALLPTLSGTVSAPHQLITRQQTVFGANGVPATITSPATNYVAGTVLFTQPIVNVQAWHVVETAKRNEDVTRLSVDDTKRQISLAVANALVAVVSAERVAELNRVGLRSALAVRQLTARKQVIGIATGLDVARTEQNVAAARTAIVSGDEALRQAREALGLALGLPEAVGVAPSVNVDSLATAARRSCPEIGGLGDRADILAATKRVEVAQRTVVEAGLAFLPTLGVQSQLTSSSANVGGTTLPTTWSITGVLTVPIFDGGARFGTLDNTRALRDESSCALEAARRSATIAVTQAERSVSVAESARNVAAESERAAAHRPAHAARLSRRPAHEPRSRRLGGGASAGSGAARDQRIQPRDRSPRRLVRARALSVAPAALVTPIEALRSDRDGPRGAPDRSRSRRRPRR